LIVRLTQQGVNAEVSDTPEWWAPLWFSTAPSTYLRDHRGRLSGTAATVPEIIGRLGPVLESATASEVVEAGSWVPLNLTSDIMESRYAWRPAAGQSEADWSLPLRFSVPVADGQISLPLSGSRSDAARVELLIAGTSQPWGPSGWDIEMTANQLVSDVPGMPAEVAALDPYSNYFPWADGAIGPFYCSRIREASSSATRFVLQFIGPNGDAWPEATSQIWGGLSGEGYTSRFQVRDETQAVTLEQTPALFYRLAWAAPSLEETTVQDPATVALDDSEAMLFAVGAEAPEALTPTLVSRVLLEESVESITDCQPLTERYSSGAVYLLIESGGFPLGVLTTFDGPLGACLVENIRHLRFPITTGAPVTVGLPLEFTPEQNTP
ncbi:MAG: hypothetical protein KC910_36370, partial [Candidatus Eremiobacteraeota bacterium]|nr:hypothetical protein [Candidatus Eremiobacteraeota bacterium]